MEYPLRRRLTNNVSRRIDPVVMRTSPLLLAETSGWTLVPWARDHLPQILHARGLWGVPVWQWLVLVLLMVASVPLGRLLRAPTTWLVGALARRTRATWDDLIFTRMRGPIAGAWTLAIFASLVPYIGFGELGRARIGQALSIGVLGIFFAALVRLIDVATELLLSLPWAARRPEISRSMLPLAQQALKGALIALGVVTILSELGFPVSSLLAGLGIGGVAVALAGQKTVENLFGAFSLGIDQPFRLGDWVSVEGGVSGHVERIGMRSTRLRTAERTLVTIPNGKLSELRLETFAARDRFLLSTRVGLVYGTSAAEVREVITGLEDLLAAQPTLHRDSRVVRLLSLGPTSLELEVIASFATQTYDAFRDVRQEVLLGILEVVARAGTSLAFPTQTIQLETTGSTSPAPSGSRPRSQREEPERGATEGDLSRTGRD